MPLKVGETQKTLTSVDVWPAPSARQAADGVPVSLIVRAVLRPFRSVENAPPSFWRHFVKIPVVHVVLVVQGCAGLAKTPALLAQKPQKMFVCTVPLSNAVLVRRPVLRSKAIGRLPRKLAAGGGQSLLVGKSSPVVVVPGVQAKPLLGPPWQTLLRQTGQGWIPAVAAAR